MQYGLDFSIHHSEKIPIPEIVGTFSVNTFIYLVSWAPSRRAGSPLREQDLWTRTLTFQNRALGSWSTQACRM